MYNIKNGVIIRDGGSYVVFTYVFSNSALAPDEDRLHLWRHHLDALAGGSDDAELKGDTGVGCHATSLWVPEIKTLPWLIQCNLCNKTLTVGGRITVQLVSSSKRLELTKKENVLLFVCSATVESKLVKLDTSSTVILFACVGCSQPTPIGKCAYCRLDFLNKPFLS